ncbi:MAG: hypothetical protein LBU70_08730 [Chitinispirillales bacterium]|jgi:hypothetical protein|nr:hypothetical protein [Chitinispirillales bacterium]
MEFSKPENGDFMAESEDTQKKFDIYRAVGIFIIAVAVCLVLGEYVARPLLFPEKRNGKTPLNIDIELPLPDTIERKTGPRCC